MTKKQIEKNLGKKISKEEYERILDKMAENYYDKFIELEFDIENTFC
ncbi:hypothetical protein [Dethiothermospora halolimnae]